jgi:hypothetical protein
MLDPGWILQMGIPPTPHHLRCSCRVHCDCPSVHSAPDTPPNSAVGAYSHHPCGKQPGPHGHDSARSSTQLTGIRPGQWKQVRLGPHRPWAPSLPLPPLQASPAEGLSAILGDNVHMR